MPAVSEQKHRKTLTPAQRAKKSALMKAQHKDPTFRKKFLKGLKKANASPAVRKAKSKMLSEMKKRPGFERKRVAGVRRFHREKKATETVKH